MIRDLFFAEPSVIRIVLPIRSAGYGVGSTRGSRPLALLTSWFGVAVLSRNVIWYSAPFADTLRFDSVALPKMPGSAFSAFSIVTDGASNGSGAVKSVPLYESLNVPPVACTAIVWTRLFVPISAVTVAVPSVVLSIVIVAA